MKTIMKGMLSSLLMVSGFTALAHPMKLTLTLEQRTSIQELAHNVVDPNSDRYEQYYTPEEIRDLVAPTQEDYDNLLNSLRAEGFSISFESKSHLVVGIEGEHTTFEKVFRTPIRFTNRSLHTNTLKPQIPNHLSLITSLSGLDNTPKFKPLYKKAIRPLANLDDQPGILPDDVKSAYNLTGLYEQGWSGKNQDLAIATYMNFSLDDVNQYYNLIGLSPVPTVDVISFNGTAPYDADSATETELDVELSGMIAPGSNIHVFGSAANSEDGELSLFTAILDDNRSKVVNYSWGSCENSLNMDHKKDMDKVFARAVAQGVNILVASGDTGSDCVGDGTVVADWPAMHPQLVAVGGTTLLFNNDGSPYEIGWSGSGGGISKFYKLPQWQAGFRSPFVRRSYPDISFNADPSSGEGIWVRSGLNGTPGWLQIGGTSMAAPQWAGFLALVNEARQSNGKAALGFINPIIYKAANKKAIFTDITSGKNGAFKANVGWDAVTGWGSMKGETMFNFLVAY